MVRAGWTQPFLPLSLLFLVSLVYFWGIAPDMTWMGLAADSPDYVRAAYFFEPAGLGGYPLYITVGWLFERLPTNYYWSLGLLSAVSTVATSWILFLLVRHLTGRMSLGLVALVLYPASLLVWSQSVIPEVYTFTTFFIVLGVYLVLTGRYILSAVVFGLGLGTHFLILTAIPPVILYLRKKGFSFKQLLVYFGVLLIGGVLALSQFWLVGGFDSERGSLVFGSLGLFASLPVVPLDPTLQRLQEFLVIIFLGPGLLLTFLVLGKLRTVKFSKSTWTPELVLLGILAGLYLLVYLISFPPQWVVYLVPGFALLIVFCLVLVSRIFPELPPSHSGIVVGLGVLLLFANLLFYDIGNTLDPQPTTARQFWNQLDSLPDGSIVYSYVWGYPHILVESYSRFNNSRVVGLTATWDQETREKNCTRVKIVCPENMLNQSIPLGYGLEVIDAKNLQRLNPDREVWVAYIQDPGSTKFNLVPVESYTTYLNRLYSSAFVTGE